MSNDVVITMTAQDAQMVAAWQKARAQGPEAYERSLQRLNKTSQETQDSGVGAFRQITNYAAGAISAVGAVTTAAQLFRAEWDAILARQQRAADRQVDIASAFRRAASVGRELKPDEIYSQVSKNANSQQMAQDLMLSFEAATSAAGAETTGQAILDAVIASARQRPDLDQTARTSLITGALQLQKNFGGDINTAMAAVQQSFGTSRAENVGAFAKNVIPSVTDLAAQGGGKDSFRDLMGLAVGFGQRTNDATGERTRTALASLAKQARETAITKGLVGKDASVLESIEAIRNSPKVQAELLGVFAQQTTGKSSAQLKKDMKKGTLTAEAAQFQAAVELFQGGDNATTRAVREATSANAGMTAAAVAEIEGKQKEIAASKALTAANLATAHERIMTDVDLNDSAAVRARARAVSASAFELMPKGINTSLRRIGLGAAAPINDVVGWAQGETDAQFVRGQAGQISQTFRGVTGKAPEGEIARLIAALEATAKQLEAQNRDPKKVAELIEETNALLGRQLKVKVEGDNRPNPPRRAPIAGAGD